MSPFSFKYGGGVLTSHLVSNNLVLQKPSFKMKELESYYHNLEEPYQSCLLALRDIIVRSNNGIEVAFKYGSPFFMHKGKMIAYLWIDKKKKLPYVAIFNIRHIVDERVVIEGRKLIQLLYVDPEQDIPKEFIEFCINESIVQVNTSKK